MMGFWWWKSRFVLFFLSLHHVVIWVLEINAVGFSVHCCWLDLWKNASSIISVQYYYFFFFILKYVKRRFILSPFYNSHFINERQEPFELNGCHNGFRILTCLRIYISWNWQAFSSENDAKFNWIANKLSTAAHKTFHNKWMVLWHD